MKPLSIYLHIPFCVSKCGYCDFVSYKPSSEKMIETYIVHLLKEIDLYKEILNDSEIKTIYFGGGTPSSIDAKWIGKIINKIRTLGSVSADCEITLEVNPGTLTLEKMNHYLVAGVNRVSMGLQTSNDTLLQTIGRIHTTNDFIVTYQALRESGFNNINLDLMFGLPGQTMDDIHHAIHLIQTLKPEHVSAYGLKLEEGTPMYEAYNKGLIKLVDETLERDMYHAIDKALKKQGIHAYELSNFAKPGYASKHNLVYWRNKPYLGFGVSAHSKLSDVRFGNCMTLKAYQDKIDQGSKPVDSEEIIDEEDELFETIILGLRLNEGINMWEISQIHGVDFQSKYHLALQSLLEERLVEIKGEILSLTSLGRDFANRVFLAFYPER